MADFPTIRRHAAVCALAVALALAGCSSKQDAGRAGGGPKGPTQVGYVVAQLGSAPLEQELPGRVAAFQISEVRPQVTGVIRRRLFREGAYVGQDQTLYQIDPSVYQAQAAQAQANLDSARASATAAQTRATRYRPLADMEAIAKQDYTDALASARSAQAAVAQNRAAVQSAQINLRFTRVPAPISGRVGVSSVTEGALVTANQADSLVTITRLDPIFVDIQQSASDMLALRKALSVGGASPTSAAVRLKLPDGSYYGASGTVEFSQVIVDPSTGTVTLRARFPNPSSILLPGMYVTAQFSQAINSAAILVPQSAVARDPQGNATVWLVGPGNKATERVIVAPRTQGQYWVVTGGLAPGDKIITQGTGSLKEGAPIKPVPANAPQRLKPGPKGAGAAAGGRGSAR